MKGINPLDSGLWDTSPPDDANPQQKQIKPDFHPAVADRQWSEGIKEYFGTSRQLENTTDCNPTLQ